MHLLAMRVAEPEETSELKNWSGCPLTFVHIVYIEVKVIVRSDAAEIK